MNLHLNRLYAILKIQPKQHDNSHAHRTRPKYSTQVVLYWQRPYASKDALSLKSVQHLGQAWLHQKFPHQTGEIDGNDLFAVFHNGTLGRHTKRAVQHHAVGYVQAWRERTLPFLQDVKSKIPADCLCLRKCTFLFRQYPLHHQLSA